MEPNDWLRKLPIEMWEKILSNIKDHLEIFKIANMNAVWRTVYLKQLPSVHGRMAFPCLLPYLNDKDLLTCCLVCHNWKDAIDDSVNKNAEHVICRKRRNFNYFYNYFDHSDHIADFLNTVAPSENCTPVNLLPYREVNIACEEVDEENEDENFIEDVANFLRSLYAYFINYGELVRRITFTLSHDKLNYVELLEMLQRVMTMTPNLHKLVVKYTSPKEMTREENTNVNFLLEHLIFPDLVNLKYFGTTFCPPSIVNTLFTRYKGQLWDYTGLDSSGMSLTLSSNKLPNENLLRPQHLYARLTNRENVDYVENFLNLHSFQISFMLIEIGGDFDNFSNKFVEVMNSQTDLDKLTLEVGIDEPNLPEKLDGLRLPKVKVLILKTRMFPGEMFFQKIAPSLQVLMLEYCGAADINQVGNIDLYKELYKDNHFWEVNPPLKIVQVTVTTLSPITPGNPRSKKDAKNTTTFFYTREIFNIIKSGIVYKMAVAYREFRRSLATNSN